MFEIVELASARCNFYGSSFLAKVFARYSQGFASRPHIAWWVAARNSLCWLSTSSPFALIVQSFSCSLCNQLNSFVRSKNCRYILKVCHWTLQLPRIHSGLTWYRLETWNIPREVALNLWERDQCRIVRRNICTRREAATGSRTCENSCRDRHASSQLLEQTLLRSYPSHCSQCW